MIGVPNNVTLTVNSVNKTYEVFDWTLDGGEKQYEFTKTYGNNIKKIEKSKDDYTVELGVVIVDATWLDDVFNSTTSMIVSLAFSDIGITVTMNECTPIGLKMDLTSDGMLEGTMTFTVPAYKSDGTESITIT